MSERWSNMALSWRLTTPTARQRTRIRRHRLQNWAVQAQWSALCEKVRACWRLGSSWCCSWTSSTRDSAKGSKWNVVDQVERVAVVWVLVESAQGRCLISAIEELAVVACVADWTRACVVRWCQIIDDTYARVLTNWLTVETKKKINPDSYFWSVRAENVERTYPFKKQALRNWSQ